jgi:hypothetical protein
MMVINCCQHLVKEYFNDPISIIRFKNIITDKNFYNKNLNSAIIWNPHKFEYHLKST